MKDIKETVKLEELEELEEITDRLDGAIKLLYAVISPYCEGEKAPTREALHGVYDYLETLHKQLRYTVDLMG